MSLRYMELRQSYRQTPRQPELSLSDNADGQQSSSLDGQTVSSSVYGEHGHPYVMAMSSNPYVQTLNDTDNIHRVYKPAPLDVPPTQRVIEWCAANGWSEPQWVNEHQNDRWWAFEAGSLMPTAIPVRFPKVDPPAGDRTRVNRSGYRLGALVSRMADFRCEYEHQFSDTPIPNLRLFSDLLEHALFLLCGDKRCHVVQWEMTDRYDRSTLLGFTISSHRVLARSMDAPPPNWSVELYELTLTLEMSLIEHLKRCNDESLLVFALEKAFAILTYFNIEVESRWLLPVGTTERSHRAIARENIIFQEISERDFDRVSACRCSGCEQRRERFTQD